MNFQPSDYLNGLNLDFEENYSNDLDVFSKNDFFNLDNFKNDYDFLNVNVKQEIKQEINNLNNNNKNLNSSDNSPISPITPITPGYNVGVKEDAQSNAMEDKKRRNTAASARFRIKKKLKEQQMELKSKELQDKVYNLEKKLMTLEMENKCLKKLIIEKNNIKNDDLLKNIKKRSMELEPEPFFSYTK